MWISVILGAVGAVLLGWVVQDLFYWKDYPMDHTNLIPLGILIAAIVLLIAML